MAFVYASNRRQRFESEPANAGRMPASPAAFAGTTRPPTNFVHNNYNNNSSEHVYLVGEGRLQFQTASKTLIVLAAGVFHSVACLREATAAAE